MRAENGPVRLFVWAGLLAFGTYLAAKTYPDLRRYFRILRM